MPVDDERPPQDPASLTFEREKWEADQRRADKDFLLRERELALKEADARRSRWWNPLAIAIMGAAIAAGGSAFVSLQNNKANLDVEEFKAEAARIFEVIKTGNPDIAANNLRFLLEAGLIQNTTTATSLKNYLDQRENGQGVALPVAQSLSSALHSNMDCRIKVFNEMMNKELPAGDTRSKEERMSIIRRITDDATTKCASVTIENPQ